LRPWGFRPQLKRDPLGGGIVRFLCIAILLPTVACSHRRLCDVAPVPSFVIVPDTPTKGLVRGVILGLPDSAPLLGAQVHVDGTDAWAISDAEGRFAVGPVRAASVTLMVRMINYGSARLALQMPPDHGVTLRIPLVPRCFHMQAVAN
jgi:carboxypeptidase family protein